MKKIKKYLNVRFSAETLREAADTAEKLFPNPDNPKSKYNQTLGVEHDDSYWRYDDPEEFFADYRNSTAAAAMEIFCNYEHLMELDISGRNVQVSVKAPTRAIIGTIFDVFERNYTASRLPALVETTVKVEKPVVFIGHGRSALWKELKDHLQDKHGVIISAYETGARAGHAIRDVLEEMIEESHFALLVLTGEDETASGSLRARQNVVHECGLFQGRLGFSRAIMLVEEGIEDFSNVAGIQQIRFSKGNIKETFGEVLATLKREFGPV
ncbi:MAG: nucleotide-binding protein [Burkholderiaceae bacterium]|nr:nucleotide-binding protein [Burkholderiaceae bacterium]